MARVPANLSRRDGQKKPTIRNEHASAPKESNMANIMGGLASGFGFGTGMEVAKEMSHSIFGKPKVEQKDKSCQMLSEMLVRCQDEFSDCKSLVHLFTEHCQYKKN